MAKGKKASASAWVGIALALWLSGASSLAAPLLLETYPYIVNHELKQCLPNPGIGIAGWEPAEACPEGYQLVKPSEPELPWYIKLMKLLDSMFGLSNKLIWVPKVSTLAAIASAILLIRRFLQLFGGVLEKVTHGIGPVVLNAVISFYVVLEGKLSDGLTAYELVEAVLTFLFTWGFWEAMKKLVRGRANA